MPIGTQDLVRGIDFTGITPQTAAEHNQLVDQSTPANDGDDTIGTALIKTTTDTALGVPSVPRADITTKWKRYIWVRRPFAGSTVPNSQAYGWNDNAPNDPVLLKWTLIAENLDALSTDVANALAEAATALLTANAANATATNANNLSTAANNTSTAANNTAISAQNLAAIAQQKAVDAYNLAQTAIVSAGAANDTANAPSSIANLIVGPYPGDMIRVKADGSLLEYFLPQDQYVRAVYAPNVIATPAGTTVGITVSGREYHGKVYAAPFTALTDNTGSLATLTPSTGVFTLQPGAYKAKFKYTIIATITTTIANPFIFAHIVKNSDASVLVEGLVAQYFASGAYVEIYTEGLFIITSATAVRVDISVWQRSTSTSLPSISIGSIVGDVDPYACDGVIEFYRIGF